jgi:Family of unknown function (DUF6055)
MRLFTVLAAATMVVAGLGTPSNSAPSNAAPSNAGPSNAAPSTQVVPTAARAADRTGEQALAHAQAALAGEPGLEITPALAQLQQVLPELDRTERATADGILSRPTDANPRSWEADYGDVREARPVCNNTLCIHYVRSGPHRPSLVDRDRDGRPDWVETTLATMKTSWTTEVGSLDYQRPRRDGTRGNVAGVPSSRGKIDVYLAQLPAGLFGYAVPESDPAATSDGRTITNTAHMVLDADFAGFNCAPTHCLRVTAAHEFFHIIQFAYDSGEEPWLLESTATWMEERVYDGVNDNRNYIRFSSLSEPTTYVNESNGKAEYGNWVFHEFYTQRLGRDTVRSIWARARTVGARSAVDGALRARGTSLRGMFAKFGMASNAPQVFWSEGSSSAYVEPATKTGNLPLLGSSANTQVGKLDHLTSRDFLFTPRENEAKGTTLELTVTGEGAPTAYALLQRSTGTWSWVELVPGKPTTVAFDPTVARLFVNVGNASPYDGRMATIAATVVTP